MADSSENKIDFEEWSTLASSDPEKFEQLRQDKISAFIGKMDGERKIRLQGLQWQIDRVRDKHKNSSTASCIEVSKLMWQTFEQLSSMLQAHAENQSFEAAPYVSAKILPFPSMAQT